MTYEQTIEWLYEQLPMFSRIGAAAYKKDLHNTIALCKVLDHPENKFRSVHVAGTNGKGSTSHMLAAIFQEAGYKTGLYTSPHIHDFRERIRINGQFIRKDFVTGFVEQMRSACISIEPSFFELTVAMAYQYFAEEQVDIAIIETGLGGRLDSTNVITPVLSVITNIGYDHMSILGNTLQLIAGEKAGIIKTAVPAVIGEVLPETRDAFEKKAAETGSALYYAEQQYQTTETIASGNRLHCTVINIPSAVTTKYALDLTGLYQSRNLCTVLTAVDVLRQSGFSLSEQHVYDALGQVKKKTGLKGRWDQVGTSPDIIIDVAHNAEGIKQVLEQLDRLYPASKRHFVLGFVNDKDLHKIFSLLSPADHYYFTQAHSPRALPHEDLKKMAAEYTLMGNSYDQVDDALDAAIKNARPEDVILVCGSFFIIAELSSYQSGECSSR